MYERNVNALEKRNENKVNRQNEKTESRQMVLGKNKIYSNYMKGQKYIIVIEDDETCNCDIHDYLKEDEEYEFISCPFCEKERAEHK